MEESGECDARVCAGCEHVGDDARVRGRCQTKGIPLMKWAGFVCQEINKGSERENASVKKSLTPSLVSTALHAVLFFFSFSIFFLLYLLALFWSCMCDCLTKLRLYPECMQLRCFFCVYYLKGKKENVVPFIVSTTVWFSVGYGTSRSG